MTVVVAGYIESSWPGRAKVQQMHNVRCNGDSCIVGPVAVKLAFSLSSTWCVTRTQPVMEVGGRWGGD